MTDLQLALLILGAIASAIPLVLTQVKNLLARWKWFTEKVSPEITSLLLQGLALGLGVGGVFVAVDSKLFVLPQSQTSVVYLYLFFGAACAYGGEGLRLVAVFLYTRSFPVGAAGAQSATARRGYLPWV